MTGGGGWLGSDGDPSAELEARWGPPGRTAPPAERRRAVVAGVVAVVLAAVVGMGLAMTGGDGPDRTVEAASARPTTTITDDLRESARAFGERWTAGPSTTMPLGAAGVPPEERPTTTTSAPRPVPQQPRLGPPGSDMGGGGSFEEDDFSFEEDERYVDEDWQEPEDEPEPPPKLAADDPRLRGAEQGAQAFVDAVMRRDCDAAWAMLSTPTLEFFAAMESEGEAPVKQEFCASLQEEEIPQIAVLPPARPYRDGALVDTEADGEVAPLAMLLEGERWTVDLLAGGE